MCIVEKGFPGLDCKYTEIFLFALIPDHSVNKQMTDTNPSSFFFCEFYKHHLVWLDCI